jgi:hypothetical protein
MMHDWPQSGAVTNPFTVGWRPLVGQTNIPIDQQSVMNRRRDYEALLAEIKRIPTNGPNLRNNKLLGVLDHPDFHISSLECLGCPSDIEKSLVQNVLREGE